jgi:hypothetical protein
MSFVLKALKEEQLMPERDDSLKSRISRRTLMTATGAALAGSFVGVAAQAPQQAKKAAPPNAPAQMGPDAGRSWICDDGFKNTVVNGQKGFQVRVRITGYRGLPLNCFSGAELKIDGQRVDPQGMILTLNNYHHKLVDLPKLGKVWRDVPEWYVLDKAELFCPWESVLAPGEHVVEGYLISRGPFGTGGRGAEGSRPRPSTTKRLVLETD